MTIPRKRRLEPVPHEPAHRRAWRSLWRRCSCGLPAPCVDRLVPAPRLPFPPTGVPPAPVRTIHAPEQPCWFATADGTATPQYSVRPSDHAYPVGGSIRSSAAWPTGDADRGEADRGEAGIRDQTRSPNDVVRPPGQTAWPSVSARSDTGWADEFDNSGAGDRSWPLSEAVPDDAAWHPSADSPSGDINPRRLSRSGQHVRAPAWDAPTVLLSQVGRAGDLTPAQAYRAGRGRSW